MIEMRQVCIRSGAFQLLDISLRIPTAGYAVLMGRTGSGKTTLLEGILGLRPVTSGQIELCGIDVTAHSPALRGIGYVPQDGALFARLTVEEHLAFALRVRHVPAPRRKQRIAELAALLGITHLLPRTPAGLSGGERQRVAIGRALSGQPRVLCLDEPLSALDSQTRSEICQLLRNIQQQTQVTTLHVTHNHDEAETLADHRFELIDGRLHTQ